MSLVKTLEEIKTNFTLRFWEKVTKWFYENYWVFNQGKFHFMCIGRNTENEIFVFKNEIIKNSTKLTLSNPLSQLWALVPDKYKQINYLTLIWMGFFGVRFEVGG